MFGRISTAMVTPFDNNGNIDFQKTEKLVEYLIHHGTDSIVVAGTTGESPTLTTEEKLALFKHVVSVVNKRVPVIAGTGTNNTRASIELTKRRNKPASMRLCLSLHTTTNRIRKGFISTLKR